MADELFLKGPSQKVVSQLIPKAIWTRGEANDLPPGDNYFAQVGFWKKFSRGTATAASFTDLAVTNPDTRKALLQDLSEAGFDVQLNPGPPSATHGRAIFFGDDGTHPLHGCQHWAVYERLGPMQNGNEYVVQFLTKASEQARNQSQPDQYVDCWKFSMKFVCLYLPEDIIPFLGQHQDCADLKFIGHGSFGGAFRLSYLAGETATLPPTRKRCIVKRNDIDFNSFKFLMREKAFLAAIDHPNIVKLHYQYVSPNYDASSMQAHNTVFFIEEDGGHTVQSYLREIYYNHSAPTVPVQAIHRICVDVLRALNYLESQSILHRDIKGDSNPPSPLPLKKCFPLISSIPTSITSSPTPDVVVFMDPETPFLVPDCTAKLIDFGLARRREGADDVFDDFGCEDESLLQAQPAADAGGFEVEGGDSKRGIAGMYRITQHAPECCEAPAGRSQRLSTARYSHKSDVWAFGTMVLWELMFCACSLNLAVFRKKGITARMYNPPLGAPQTDEHQRRHWDIANADTEALSNRVTSELRQRFDPTGIRSAEERKMFQALCDVLQRMCDSNHETRASAAVCLETLVGGAGRQKQLFSFSFLHPVVYGFQQVLTRWEGQFHPSRQTVMLRNSLICANL